MLHAQFVIGRKDLNNLLLVPTLQVGDVMGRSSGKTQHTRGGVKNKWPEKSGTLKDRKGCVSPFSSSRTLPDILHHFEYSSNYSISPNLSKQYVQTHTSNNEQSNIRPQ